MKSKFILVHNTNGEGYSDVTVKVIKDFKEGFNYAHSVFAPKHTEVEYVKGRKKDSIRTEYFTDEEGNTERVTIFEVSDKSTVLVKVNSLLTDHEVIEFKTKEAAYKEFKKVRKIITELDEESTETKAFGDEKDGYYHFEIV